MESVGRSFLSSVPYFRINNFIFDTTSKSLLPIFGIYLNAFVDMLNLIVEIIV